MPQGPPLFAIDVRNFAIVTYAVPAERVQVNLPAPYELDTFEDDGVTKAFVSSTCFCNERFRPAGLGVPRHTFNESTYRTYVTHKGRRGVYFFGRYLGTRLSWISQRPMARDTYTADFDIHTAMDADKYVSYSCHAVSSEGETSFSLQAGGLPAAKPPFSTGEEHAQFMTYRLHGFYTMAGLSAQGHMPVGHPRMRPYEGVLSGGRFDLWAELEILAPEEVLEPYSVLVVPEVPFRLYPPRPLI